MRNLLTVSTGLLVAATLGAAAGCTGGPGQTKEPPVLRVTSPARSQVLGPAGALTVSGTALPGDDGDPVAKVLVNGVDAALRPDGSFSAAVDLAQGETLIQTVAKNKSGATATDTRAVQAGQLMPVGSNVPRAVAAALSADAFARLSAAAGPIIKGLDIPALIAPLQPMLSVGDSSTGAQLFVDNVKFSDIKIALTPVQGGLSFSAEIHQLDVPAHVSFAVIGLGGSESLEVTADKIVVAGTLQVTPAGMSGFRTKLVSPKVQLTNFLLHNDLIPDTIIKKLDLQNTIQTILARVAELFMGPLVNQALGALAGPQTLPVLGHSLTMQVAPSAVSFTPDGGLVEIDMKVLLAGSESSPGFISTANGSPGMDPTFGFQLGLADDLANQLLAELTAVGALDLSVPQDVGVFDTVQIQMTLPPMINADASDGAMRLMLGDMFATFTSHGTPVGKAAINARVELKISPGPGSSSVALQLGVPELHVDTLDDIPNTTGLSGPDLANATAVGLGAQIDAISQLLVAIPVPSIAGLQFRNLSLSGDEGYVLVSGQLQ
jgi:glucodextranase-like protein